MPHPSPTSARPAPASASAKARHLEAGTATAGAGCVAVVGLSLSTLGDPHLGLFLFLAAVGLLLLDAVVAVHATRRARLCAASHPTDVVVGDGFTLCVSIAGLQLPLGLSVADQRAVHRAPASAPAPKEVVAEAPGSIALDAQAGARGVVRSVPLRARSDGLCGLVACVRAHSVPLARPLEIGPRPVAPPKPLPDLGGRWGDGVAVPATDGDMVRGVRAYLPGDRLRQVHWRATARHGELVVKETELTEAPVLHLVLDLGAGGEAGESAAGRAAWYAYEALRRRWTVLLTTAEHGRTVTAAVATAVMVNRRLARAARGRPHLRGGSRLTGRVLLVTDEGDSWP